MTSYRFSTDGTETLRDLLDRLGAEINEPSVLDRLAPDMSFSRATSTRDQFIAAVLRKMADDVERRGR